ncbi:MAG TPA: branched-chain amino acid ABC transporter permease [Ktedonobacterales bacterium]|nr:branched-chain amino acid ABC transporter permease [Ktedonobacterales bacterium]
MAQDIVNWILLGCFYAAIGLGFSLVWGLMNILNLAQGSLVILGAYVAYWSYTVLHLNPFVGILVAMGVLFCIGYAIQYVMINRVIRAPFLVTFMLTFGLDLLISNVLQDLFTAGYKAINTPYSSAGFEVLGARIPLLNLAVGAIAVALTAALSLFLSRTRIGNAILAVGMDRDAARLMGISVANSYALTFGIGAALAGAAGAMLAMTLQFSPIFSGQFTLFAFVIVALGGLGTPWGALAGGLLFAFAEVFGPLVPGVGFGLDTAIAFVVLVLVLILRPYGVLGKPFYS